jgi:vancomycin resistance protein VanJ
MASRKNTGPDGTAGLFLKRLGQTLADDEARGKCIARLSGGLRRFLGTSTFGYALLLAGLTVGFRWVGEKNLTLAFLLYLPRSLFLLPGLFLLLPALLFHRRSALALALSSLLFLFAAMGLRAKGEPGASPAVSGESLTVLTYNRGQHMNQSLKPFKNRVRPDLILLQEAPGRASGYLADDDYRDYAHAVDLGEFTLLSRYPILGSELVVLETQAPSPPLAARFVIDFAGQPVVVYSVHPASPRDTLNYYRRGAFLYGIIGLPGTPWSEPRRVNQAYWDRRIDEAEVLLERVASESFPVILAGDLNAPAGGYIHRLFQDQLEDAHATAGHGFGYTFPGTTRFPLSLGGPWMRIDYLFGNSHWETTWCLTEKKRPSQHRALAAQFRLRK